MRGDNQIIGESYDLLRESDDPYSRIVNFRFRYNIDPGDPVPPFEWRAEGPHTQGLPVVRGNFCGYVTIFIARADEYAREFIDDVVHDRDTGRRFYPFSTPEFFLCKVAGGRPTFRKPGYYDATHKDRYVGWPTRGSVTRERLAEMFPDHPGLPEAISSELLLVLMGDD